MEKRTLLAAILSFFVLFFWTITTQKQKDMSYHIDNKRDISNNTYLPSSPSVNIIQSTPQNEITETIDNNIFTAEFSNIGGLLKKVHIKEYDADLPVRNFITDSISDRYEYKLERHGNNEIVYIFSNEIYQIKKYYTFNPDDYTIKSRIVFNFNNLSNLNNINVTLFSLDMSNLYTAYISPDYFTGIVEKPQILFQELINLGYLNKNGLIEDKFLKTRSTTDFILSNTFNNKKKEIFDLIDKAIENGKIEGEHAIDKNLFEYAISTEGHKNIFRKNNAFRFSEADSKHENVRIDWIGFRDRYFCAIVKPNFSTAEYQLTPIDLINKEEQVPNKKGYLGLNISVKPDKENLIAGKPIELNSTIYVGPENLYILKKYHMGFESIKKFYRFGLFDAIAHVIYSMLHFVYKLIPNWGVCIILISSFIYLSMYPLTFKGMASMKKMQALQPKITILREKYKNSPEKLNKEMIELYKENSVNPLSGCLPLLLQMPVFIGLYQVFWRDVSFKDSGFLWIKDLSHPDKFITFPWSLPIIGQYLNILPIAMVVIMFFQQRMTSRNMVSSDPNQIAQQKMMGIMMPLMLGFIFYNFASGLNLYFTVLYGLQTIFQWKMSKETKTKNE